MMKKALFVFTALLTAACSSGREQQQQPTVVYRGYDDQGCNYYNGVCHRANRKYIVENNDGEVQNPNYRPTTNIVTTGQYKHCSNVIFGDPVPAPKFVANGPKVVTQQMQQVEQAPVRQVQYVRQIPVQYVQQPAIQYVQPTVVTTPSTVVSTQPCNGCQPVVTQTREPVEVLYKKTTTTTVYEPKTTQQVNFEKEPYTGQLSCTDCATSAPAVVQAPTLNVPAPTVVTIPTQTVTVPVNTIPEARLVSEISMDPAEIK